MSIDVSEQHKFRGSTNLIGSEIVKSSVGPKELLAY